MSVLLEILTNKRAELDARIRSTPLDALRARGAHPVRPAFEAALRRAPIGLIAEVKHKSPSGGLLRDPFDPAAIARAYESAGAQALSVLVDERYFGGGEAVFQAVRDATTLPLLYKEFVIDPWQVWHAVSIGASALLLIVAALDRAALDQLLATCADARIEALVEVHDEDEADVAVAAGARLIGVNNRNLKTLQTSLETTHRVRSRIPRDRFLVGESGIRTAADVVRLKKDGAGAVLVGEHLLRQPDPAAAARALMSEAWRT